MPRRIAMVAALLAAALLLALPGAPGARDRDRHERGDQAETKAGKDRRGKDRDRGPDEDGGEVVAGPEEVPEGAVKVRDEDVKGKSDGERGKRGRRDGEVIPDQYIVVYEPSVDSQEAKEETKEIEEEQDVDAEHRYSRALRGFSAEMSEEQAEAIEEQPEVAAVVPDRVVEASGSVALAAGDASPTGVRRFGAATSATTREASSTNVAVIDTGIDLDHPDLNVSAGRNCTGSGAPTDGDGHGTHVAGTIAARNNGSGVVGVAPGTKVYAVKVLGDDGEGSWSNVICGIDWVTANRSANNIGVANLSLGGVGSTVDTSTSNCDQMTSDPLRRAICKSTNAGVTYVVAAGNSDYDFDYLYEPDVPAAYPEVLTVTAMSDANGTGGGGGGAPSCDSEEGDDTHASFSNFAQTNGGRAHTIAAPGVCIRSTVPDNTHATYSGTSMATPHVTGAIALCIGEGSQAGPCSGMSPSQIISRMRSVAQEQRSANGAYGFQGDPANPVGSEYFGYLAFAGVSGPDLTSPAVTSVYPSAGASGVSTATGVSVTFSEAMDRTATQGAFSLTRSATGAAVGGSFAWSGNTMVFQPSSALAAGSTYVARVTTAAKDTSGNALASQTSWSFTTASATTGTPATCTKKKKKKCKNRR